MQFIKKNLLKIEIYLTFILIIIIVGSIGSVIATFTSLIEDGSFSLFTELWLYLYGINFTIEEWGLWGMAINIIFYAFLVIIPILGLIFKNKKGKHLALHITLMTLIIGHLFIFGAMRDFMATLASV